MAKVSVHVTGTHMVVGEPKISTFWIQWPSWEENESTSGKILLVNEISVEEIVKKIVSSEVYLSMHGLLGCTKYRV
jgi:hypothetical protein